MKSRQIRMLMALSLGLLALAVSGCTCQKKCDMTTCAAGCCSTKGECLEGTAATACGTAANMCASCTADQTCTAGACVTTVVNTDDGGTDAGFDAGPPPCARDLDCAYLKNGSICNEQTGACIPGQGCSSSAECQTDDSESPCYRYGIQCYCDTRDAPDAGLSYAGTCRRRLAACEECQGGTPAEENARCGDELGIFDPPEGQGKGKCAQLQGDQSGKKYCLREQVGQCACGTINDGTGYCRPQSNSCNQVGCNVDMDCPSGAVCSVNNPDAGAGSCGGICEARCRWDFATKDLVAPGCPPSKPACWVDAKNLAPDSPTFGAGRCRPACSTNDDCKESVANPFGGPRLACRGEALNGGGTGVKRCRAAGQCMDSLECPELPNEQPYFGYCNRDNLTCATDCRTGNDPVTALPYKDCRSPYACAADGGARICRLLNCQEQGGASIACSRGQYCAGQDKNGDTLPDPQPPTSEQDDVGCYTAPNPPFCHTCMSDDDCTTIQLPSWMSGSGACANGARNPICSPMPNRCVYAGDRDNMGTMGVNICMMGTANDSRSVPARAVLGCPQGYEVTPLAYKWNAPSGDDYCVTNADCQVGNDAGVCEPDPSLRLQDAGFRKVCRCTAGPNGDAQCPNDADAGIRSACRGVVPGTRTYCLDSIVCIPKANVVYKIPDSGQPIAGANYGCGL